MAAMPTHTAKILKEATRASALAAHSAAGLCRDAGPPAKEAMRLLRSAEALARAALASLQGTGLGTYSATAGAPVVEAGKVATQAVQKQRTRKRGKRKKKATNGDEEITAGGLLPMDGAPPALGPGESLLHGDLTELGITTQFALVPQPSSTRPTSAIAATSPSAPSRSACGPTTPPVSEVDVRALVANFATDQLRCLARSLGGTGQGKRKGLIAFCVARRFGGPRRAEVAELDAL